MKETFIIIGFVALLANIFYLVFWVSREIGRHLTYQNKKKHKHVKEEYSKILNQGVAPRPWALGYVPNYQGPTVQELINQSILMTHEPLKIIPERDTFAFPIAGEVDSHGDSYSQECIDEMKKHFIENAEIELTHNSDGTVKKKTFLDGIEWESSVHKSRKYAVLNINELVVDGVYKHLPTYETTFTVKEIINGDRVCVEYSNGRTDVFSYKAYSGNTYYQELL